VERSPVGLYPFAVLLCGKLLSWHGIARLSGWPKGHGPAQDSGLSALDESAVDVAPYASDVAVGANHSCSGSFGCPAWEGSG